MLITPIPGGDNKLPEIRQYAAMKKQVNQILNERYALQYLHLSSRFQYKRISWIHRFSIMNMRKTNIPTRGVIAEVKTELL